MFIIFWLDLALDDLLSIIEYVDQFNPNAAERLQILIEDSVTNLATNPYIYKPSSRVVGGKRDGGSPKLSCFLTPLKV